MQESPYEYLNRKSIINILIGDKLGVSVVVGNTTIEATMPYLSGPQICDLSGKLGNPIHYPQNGGGSSRWQYFENLLNFCIQNKKEKLLLQELFNSENFKDILRDCDTKDIKSAYDKVVECVLEYINKELYFCKHQLRKFGSCIYICAFNTPLL